MIKPGGCYRHRLSLNHCQNPSHILFLHSFGGMSQATATASRFATKCPHRHFLALYNPINQPIYIFSLSSLRKLRFLRPPASLYHLLYPLVFLLDDMIC